MLNANWPVARVVDDTVHVCREPQIVPLAQNGPIRFHARRLKKAAQRSVEAVERRFVERPASSRPPGRGATRHLAADANQGSRDSGSQLPPHRHPLEWELAAPIVVGTSDETRHESSAGHTPLHRLKSKQHENHLGVRGHYALMDKLRPAPEEKPSSYNPHRD